MNEAEKSLSLSAALFGAYESAIFIATMAQANGCDCVIEQQKKILYDGESPTTFQRIVCR